MLAITTSILVLLTTACVAQDPAPPDTSPSTTTQTYQRCGGFVPTPNPCPWGYVCTDDLGSDGCGMVCDMPGTCIEYEFCGGLAGIQCADGKQCVDDPGDLCDPLNGGFDCGGICV